MLLLYKIIPRADVSWRTALAGSFLAATLLEIARALFGYYVRMSLTGNNWFGALAIVPLFMFWVYLLWQITLSGLQISYILQHFEALKGERGG
jgi:membrane protein